MGGRHRNYQVSVSKNDEMTAKYKKNKTMATRINNFGFSLMLGAVTDLSEPHENEIYQKEKSSEESYNREH